MPVACCYICRASFGAPQTLNRHIKEVHNTENILTVNCSQCDYVGKQRNLLNHIRSAHGEKKICKMCDKPFHDKATLNRHIKNKHNFETFVCPVCNATFSRKEFT